MTASLRVHGTAIAWDGAAALFRGPSGAGKSDLALRCIERGAQLVGDDQVWIDPGTPPDIRPDPRLAGKLEVRGIGILEVSHSPSAPLWAVFDLVAPDNVPRLPEEKWTEWGPDLRARCFALAPFEGSAPDKIRLTLSALAGLPGKV